MSVLAGVRSFLAFVLILLWFVPLSLMQRLLVWPAVALSGPRRRLRIVSRWMKFCAGTLLGLTRLGGVRAHFTARVPTASPIIIVANHQSLLEILVITLMGDPYVPAFVTRTRYGRFIPTVSLCVRMLRAPLIDPHDRKQALREMERHAQRDHQGFIIFPEGHRTRDGRVLPFKTAGLEVLLRARRVPVYLAVSDGYWVCPRLLDFIFRMHRIDGRTEVLGPFELPDDDIAAFVQHLRAIVVERVEQMRAAHRAA